MLKPRLSIKATRDKDDMIFDITCNYHPFITRSNIKLYDQSYNLIKTIDLPNPIPSTYTLPVSEIIKGQFIYYQLSVYDKNNKEDRTGIGSLKIQSW